MLKNTEWLWHETNITIRGKTILLLLKYHICSVLKVKWCRTCLSLFFSTVDGYGFQRSETFDQKGYDDFMSQYLGVMTRRAMRWNNVFGNSDKITRSRLGMLCCSSYIGLNISFILFHSMCSQKFRPGNHPKVCGSLPHLNLISHLPHTFL